MNFGKYDIPEEHQIFGSRLKYTPFILPEEVEKVMKEQLVEKAESSEVNKKRASRRKKSSTETKDKLDKSFSEDDLLFTKESLPTRVKRKLDKFQKEEERKLKKIHEENSSVLSLDILEKKQTEKNVSEITETEAVSVFDKKICLNVVYLSKSLKFYCDKKENFSNIFQKVADAFQLKASEFLLCYNNLNIQVGDTPESLNMSIVQEIECIPYSCKENLGKKSDKNMLKVKLQSDDRKENVEIFVHKLEKIQNLMEKYAKLKGILLERIVFEFDGEKIEGTETPEELELENECCIDVKIIPVSSKKHS